MNFDWLSLLKFLAPIILVKINPHLAQVSDSIIHGITEAQKMKDHDPTVTNEQQLEHAVNITNDAVAAINAGTGKVLIDPVIVNNAAGAAISTIVEVAKLVHKSDANINK